MSVVTINDIDFTGNPCRRVTATWNGRTFTAGERTWAHLFYTQAYLDEHHPDWYIYVVQGAYNTGVILSAGTHDLDGTLDVYIINRKTGRKVWIRGRQVLRLCGWAAWWRNKGSWASPSAWHIHMNSLGCAEAGCPVGIFIPGQNRDYLSAPPRDGLAGHGRDRTWHPDDIEATVFNYQQWLRKETLMAKLDDEDLAAVRQIVAQELEKSWGKPQANGYSRTQNLMRIANKIGVTPKAKKAVK